MKHNPDLTNEAVEYLHILSVSFWIHVTVHISYWAYVTYTTPEVALQSECKRVYRHSSEHFW